MHHKLDVKEGYYSRRVHSFITTSNPASLLSLSSFGQRLLLTILITQKCLCNHRTFLIKASVTMGQQLDDIDSVMLTKITMHLSVT